jgi:hypothetical protein
MLFTKNHIPVQVRSIMGRRMATKNPHVTHNTNGTLLFPKAEEQINDQEITKGNFVAVETCRCPF